MADNRKAAAYIVGRLCYFVACEVCEYAQMLCEPSLNLLEKQEEFSKRR